MFPLIEHLNIPRRCLLRDSNRLNAKTHSLALQRLYILGKLRAESPHLGYLIERLRNEYLHEFTVGVP